MINFKDFEKLDLDENELNEDKISDYLSSNFQKLTSEIQKINKKIDKIVDEINNINYKLNNIVVDLNKIVKVNNLKR